MRVGVLGPLEVEAGAQVTGIRGARLRMLLIRLALDAGRVVTVESLARALWAEDPPGDPAHALQALVSRLRRALPGPPALRSAPSGYRLDIPPEAVDAIRFERLARQGRRALRDGEPHAAAEQLREALDLWRGEALADAGQAPFAAPVITRLTELRLAAVEDRIAADLEGQPGPGHLVAELEELTAAHPLRERLRLLHIKALHTDGRPAEALAAYESFRELLAAELGANPGPELQEAHLAVLRGEPPVRRASEQSRPAGNLRAALSSFVGREHEQASLTVLLERERLVTLTGPGGAGKTRLATTVAAAAADFPGGVWLVELAPVTSPGQVAQAWITALGLREQDLPGTAPQDSVTRLAEALSATGTLIVVDNCEHLVSTVAPLVEDLLGRCPRLRVLATSREPLGVPGEVLYPVPPLGVPDPQTPAAQMMTSPAVRLFADRAAAAAPGFAVTGANAAMAGEICRRLDGLPLAIELAAARLRSLPLEDLAARLGDRFAVLTTGNRTAPPRHQTLRAVVAWSWDLLDDDERELAERLSVFPAGITPDGAEAVRAERATGRPVLDLLAALVDKSLLQLMPGDTPRYRMLETIREFGLARLASTGKLARARSVHAAYFLDLAETAEPYLRSERQLPWLDTLGAEHGNLLAALHAACETGEAETAVRLAAALGTFWTVQGKHGEAAASLRLALQVPGEAPAQARAAATAWWAFNATLAGYPARANGAVEVMRARAASAGEFPDHPVSALLEPALALAADDARAGLAAISARLAHPEPWTRAMLHLIRAFLAGNHGDMDGQCRDLASAVAAFRAAGERWGLAMALMVLGYTQTTLGEFGAAVAALEESVQVQRELGPAGVAVMQRVWLADALRKKGEARRARAELLQIVSPSAGPRPGRYTFLARITLGDLARAEGDQEEATRQYDQAAGDLRELPASTLWVSGFGAMLGCALVHLAVCRGDLTAAGRHLGEALALAVPENDMPMLAVAGVAAARLRFAQGARVEAARLLGATHALRGAPDAFNPDVASLATDLGAELGGAAYRSAYGEGRRLDRAAALALIQAAP